MLTFFFSLNVEILKFSIYKRNKSGKRKKKLDPGFVGVTGLDLQHTHKQVIVISINDLKNYQM